MERCRTIPEVYGFEVVLKQAIPLLPESLKDQRERFGRMALPENRVGKAVLPDSGSSPKNPQHHLPCRVCSEFTTFSPRSSQCSVQHLNFSRQAGSDLGFRLRPFSFFLSTGTSARLSQLAQPDWNLLGFGPVEKLVDSTQSSVRSRQRSCES